MIKIITDVGYCYGVKHAIKTLEQASEKNKSLTLLHPLIHNIKENQSIMERTGSHLFNPETDIQPEAVVFSAHGFTKEEEKKFSGKSVIINGTCPLIISRYEKISALSPDVDIVFLGKKGHQETLGFLSHFPRMKFIDQSLDLETQISNLQLKENLAFVPQTTVSAEAYKLALKLLSQKGRIVFSLPICSLYGQRTEQALSFLKNVDFKRSVFVVIGDKTSSNANEIFRTIQNAYPQLSCKITLNPADINPEEIHSKDIFLSSATSTSSKTVDEFITALVSSEQKL